MGFQSACLAWVTREAVGAAVSMPIIMVKKVAQNLFGIPVLCCGLCLKVREDLEPVDLTDEYFLENVEHFDVEVRRVNPGLQQPIRWYCLQTWCCLCAGCITGPQRPCCCTVCRNILLLGGQSP